MKCLMKYQWVKLPRNHIPQGKGIMGAWARLASRAAFRKGYASYCGYRNAVSPGMWSGGIVGLKSILGVKSRLGALETIQMLSDLGYAEYSLEQGTKRLTYTISDWVVKCSGKACTDETVCATEGYGFLCLPRSITDRLVENKYKFEDADAWLDLWCHTVSEEKNNAFSYLTPIVQYGKYGIALTLEALGRRWGWEKTKVWRFFKKHGDDFALYRLPGSYGCLIFNRLYPNGTEASLPSQEDIIRIIDGIRILGVNTHRKNSENEHINRIAAWYSRRLTENEPVEENMAVRKCRVALFKPIIRVYLSLCRNCKNCKADCRIKDIYVPEISEEEIIRGPCGPSDITKIAKECFIYG